MTAVLERRPTTSAATGASVPPARSRRLEHAVLVVLLVAVGLAHGINMFHFPYYESDEGTYIAQAYSFVEQGSLAPYTYWYDHSPAGWMLIGVWAKATGGFFTFGFSVNSGRALMLVLHLLSCVLMYVTVRRVTGNAWAAVLAVALFSFAPGGIYFQRRVLLDNIAMFWTILSLTALVMARQRMSRVVAAALLLAVAILSKETMIVFLPGLMVGAVLAVARSQRLLAALLFPGLTACGVSLYFLYAALKGELFPTGTPLGGDKPHVSLLGTLHWQVSRDGGGLTGDDSTFRAAFSGWFSNDPVWLVLCVVVSVVVPLIAIRHSAARPVALLLAGYWLYLLRGGLILPFYVIPLYALVGLAAGVGASLVAQPLAQWASHKPWLRIGSRLVGAATAASLVLAMFVVTKDDQRGESLYSSDQTGAQIEAAKWLLERKNARVAVIDNYAYVDVNSTDRPASLRPEWYWKMDLDPEIRYGVASNDPGNIEYLGVTPQMSSDLERLPFTRGALSTSRRVASFQSGGWGVDYWVNMTPEHILRTAWTSYVEHFITDGRVRDPQQGNTTTSEGQAYALFRAVQADDRETFDAVLRWSDGHLRTPSGLWGWRWTPSPDAGPTDENTTQGTLDRSSASDADTDAALALVLAGRRWKDPQYTTRAQKTIRALWRHDVAPSKIGPVMTAGPWARKDGTLTLNPSYFSPAAYREFAALDPAHDWTGVLSSSFSALRGCAKGKLPPDWCSLSAERGTFGPSQRRGLSSDEFGYDAMRTPWRFALDWQWTRDPRNKLAARSFAPLVRDWQARGRLSAVYTTAGGPVRDDGSAAAYGATLGAFVLLAPGSVPAVYRSGLLGTYIEDDERGYWQDPDNYYTQNWAWLGTALAAGELRRFDG